VTESPAHVDTPPPGSLRTADLLGALSLAGDLAVGLQAEHAVRSCYIGMHLADQLHLLPDQKVALYYAELLMDAGCTAWTSQLAAFFMSDEIAARRQLHFYTDERNALQRATWLKNYVAAGAPPHTKMKRIAEVALHGREFREEGFRNTCEVAGRFAARLGMSTEVQTALRSIYEQWDGSGPNGTRGEQIPITSRIVYATSFLEAFHRMGGRSAALQLARERKDAAFDPAVVEGFLAVSRQPTFWEGLEQESVLPAVLAMEPQSPYRYLREGQLEDVAQSFADYADIKSVYSVGHSRRTAALAVRIARQMRLPADEVTTIRRAALLHDLGLVTVPSFTLEKPQAQLTQVERERLRLHPYHAERIVARVPALARVAPLVAAHHERLDGQGYYRGLSGAQIPVGARIIAVSDYFDELCHDTADQPGLDPEAALQRMGAEVGTRLCPEAYRSLAQALGTDAPAPVLGRSPRAPEWPADLTGREVEILRLLARGVSRRQIAEKLVLSEHTVRHHMEHIYDKAGVSTRVAATLFAVEHDLLH
jgi:HD-GYP domain-containing protein (c-di-GMP phosphodiesterase class II)/DNA-binding CsgD family transcriptional regulator